MVSVSVFEEPASRERRTLRRESNAGILLELSCFESGRERLRWNRVVD